MIPPEEFFALVDRHLTPPMADAGYTKIGDFDQVTVGARPTPLRAVRPRRLAPRRWHRLFALPRLRGPRGRGAAEHVLTVGYEGDGDDDERWLRYYPDTSELDVRDWREAQTGRADWDITGNLQVSSASELEHRLQALGRAIAALPPF